MQRTKGTDTAERGRAVAALLSGAWRAEPPALTLSMAQLPSLIPYVISSGAGSLAWWKLRRQTDAAAVILDKLAHIYRLHTLEVLRHEIRLEETLQTLRWWAGVEPLVSKGWTVARLYPEPALRPYGDLDLHFDPCRLAGVVRTLADRPRILEWVDLHAAVPELAERTFGQLQQRAQRLKLLNTMVCALSVEDQLRHLCLHFTRHGGWRPLWLCDVAVLVESLPAGFDWEYCLRGAAWRSAWVRAVIQLAGRLLGARVPALAELQPSGPEIGALADILLDEWGRTEPGDSHTRDRTSMVRHLWRPWRLWRGVRLRLPNAIEAAFNVQAAPADAALHWHRLRFCWRRTLRFMRRVLVPWSAPAATDTAVHVHRAA